MRLDHRGADPEVGASTYNFTPSPETKIFVSQNSIASANKAIEEEATMFNSHDLDAQIRQVRSQLTVPSTYSPSRAHSEWVDNAMCRPFAIFTLCEKSGIDGSADYAVASKILLLVADAMRFNDGMLKKKDIAVCLLSEKKTAVPRAIEELMSLFKKEQHNCIIGNEQVEQVLYRYVSVIYYESFSIKMYESECLFYTQSQTRLRKMHYSGQAGGTIYFGTVYSSKENKIFS